MAYGFSCPPSANAPCEHRQHGTPHVWLWDGGWVSSGCFRVSSLRLWLWLWHRCVVLHKTYLRWIDPAYIQTVAVRRACTVAVSRANQVPTPQPTSPTYATACRHLAHPNRMRVSLGTPPSPHQLSLPAADAVGAAPPSPPPSAATPTASIAADITSSSILDLQPNGTGEVG